MKVHEIMTARARCVGPDNTLVEAAGLMRELDVGALPVCDEDRLAGMVTDRDLALRAIAEGRDPNTTTVRDVMSPGAIYVFAEQEVEEAVRLMEQRQVRRLPVLNREKRLVGIMSLGDLAISSHPAFSGMALRDVSEPREPNARQRRLAERSRPMSMPAVNPTDRTQADARQPRRRTGTTARKKSSRTTSRRGAAGRKTTSRGTRSSAGRSRRSPAWAGRAAG